MLDLHPVVLQVGGLQSALGAICTHHSRFDGYRCDVEIDPAAAGERDELVLALARELLRNVAKHAERHAGSACACTRIAEGVVLDVTDDGEGVAAGPAAARRSARATSASRRAASAPRRSAAACAWARAATARAGTQAVALLPVRVARISREGAASRTPGRGRPARRG